MSPWPLLVLQFAVLAAALSETPNPRSLESPCKRRDPMQHQIMNETFDYNRYFDRCIDIQTQPDTWDNQQINCWNRQGDLEVPRTLDENKALYNLAFMLYSEQDPPMTQLWIGARWSDAYQAIITTTNETLPLTNNWEEPDDGGNGRGKCVALNIWAEDDNNEERWSKVDCDKKLPSICFELKGNTTHPPTITPSTTPTTSITRPTGFQITGLTTMSNITTSTGLPTTTAPCPSAACACDELPLCASTSRCHPDACLIEDSCYSVLRGPMAMEDAYGECNKRKGRHLFNPDESEAKFLFRIIATTGETCNATTIKGNPDYLDAVWSSHSYNGSDPQRYTYNPTHSHKLHEWHYAVYYTKTACWTEYGTPLYVKTTGKPLALYAVCVERAQKRKAIPNG